MVNYIEIKMPALSPTMESGKLIEWKKKAKDKIKAGDVLFEIETDKAIMEYESTEQGFIALILSENNTENVNVGEVVCVLAKKEEDIDDVLKNYKTTKANTINNNN